MDKPPAEGRKTHAIASAVLSDTCLVEMVYRPDQHQTAFLVWQDGGIEEHRTLDLAGIGSVVPFSPQNNLLTHQVVLFPSCARGYGSEDELLSDVRAFIHQYADLSESFEEVASYYVLFSWIYDAFREVPYLRLKGDFGSGKSRCLLTIGSLCYKPMFASGASTVSPLFRIIDTFRGTLVIDEGDFRFSDERAEIVKILNNGNTTGFPVLRSEATPTKEFNPRAFMVFGPKIIASRGRFDDPALESRCITETMTGLPPRPEIPLSLPEAFHGQAQTLRDRLLSFRFQNRSASHNLAIANDRRIEPRIAQVFGPLLAVIADGEARERVLQMAEAASGKIRAERSASVEAQLLDIMYEVWRGGEPLTIKAIAAQFGERFGNDYQRPITPRWVGAQVRGRLSLTPVKSHGTFVIPPNEERRLLSLFRRYGLGDMGTLGTSGEPAGKD